MLYLADSLPKWKPTIKGLNHDKNYSSKAEKETKNM
jgi:hypothetical protein